MNCYRFEEIKYDKGLFDLSTDATYVICMEGSPRYNNVILQLDEYKPTKTVYILFNKGFKKCTKPSYVTASNFDLIDANLTIFKHAQQMKYNNILILEDDFIFDEKVKEEKHFDEINHFLIKKSDKEFIYLLGTLPFIMIPYQENHYITLSMGMHAVFFNKKIRVKTLKVPIEKFNKIKDWDDYHNFSTQKYTYYTSLCYQLFPETENQNNWPTYGGLTYIFKKILIILKLNINFEPGYNIFYTISKILFFLIFFIIIYIIYKIYLKYKKE
jgi:hypothetical protein